MMWETRFVIRPMLIHGHITGSELDCIFFWKWQEWPKQCSYCEYLLEEIWCRKSQEKHLSFFDVKNTFVQQPLAFNWSHKDQVSFLMVTSKQITNFWVNWCYQMNMCTDLNIAIILKVQYKEREGHFFHMPQICVSTCWWSPLC